MKKTKIAAVLLSGIMAASILAGCGDVDKNAVAAVFDQKEIHLGLPNFAARLQQAHDDDIYNYYFGGNVWDSDPSGTGVTVQEDVKNNVMENLFALYTLEAHMAEYDVTLSEEEQTKISDVASEFIEANSKEALNELGAEQTIIEEYLRLMTIQAKMYQAIIADVDTKISDTEANTSAYSYVRVSKTSYTDAQGNTAEYTKEEQETLAKTIADFAAEVKEKRLEDVAEAYSYTVSTGTFTADDEILDPKVLAALQELQEGDVSEVIDTENAYYVVRLDAKTDLAATEATKKSIISERERTLYEEVLAGWQEAHTWEVKNDVWKDVVFDRQFTTVEPTVDTEEIETTEQ